VASDICRPTFEKFSFFRGSKIGSYWEVVCTRQQQTLYSFSNYKEATISDITYSAGHTNSTAHPVSGVRCSCCQRRGEIHCGFL